MFAVEYAVAQQEGRQAKPRPATPSKFVRFRPYGYSGWATAMTGERA